MDKAGWSGTDDSAAGVCGLALAVADILGDECWTGYAVEATSGVGCGEEDEEEMRARQLEREAEGSSGGSRAPRVCVCSSGGLSRACSGS